MKTLKLTDLKTQEVKIVSVQQALLMGLSEMVVFGAAEPLSRYSLSRGYRVEKGQ